MKIYLTSLLVFLFVIQMTAQNNNRQRRFEGGLVAGANISQIDGDLLYGYSKFGFNAGAKVDAILTERWRAGIEFLYVQQGAHRSEGDSYSDIPSLHDQINLNMVEVPLLVHFRDWRMQATAGISYARIINYEINWVDGSNMTDDYSFNQDVFSIIIGGSFRFTDHWALDVRWSRWISDVLPDNYEAKELVEPTTQIIYTEYADFFGKNISIRGIYTF